VAVKRDARRPFRLAVCFIAKAASTNQRTLQIGSAVLAAERVARLIGAATAWLVIYRCFAEAENFESPFA